MSQVLATFLNVPNPRTHLIPGPDAFDYVRKERETRRSEFAECEV